MKHVLASLTACTAATALAAAATVASAATINPTENVVIEDDSIEKGIRVRPNRDSGGNFNFTRKSWVKFDLTGENPDGSQSATLSLYFQGSGTGNDPPNDPDWETSVYGLNAGYTPDEINELGTDWSQSDMNNTNAWQRAPENDENSQNGFESQTTLLGTFDIDTDNDGGILDEKGTLFTISLPTLSDFLQSDGTVTIMLAATATQNTGGDSRDFWDNRHSAVDHDDNPATPVIDARPTLDFTVIPEPVTAGLIGLGSIVLLSRRRMR